MSDGAEDPRIKVAIHEERIAQLQQSDEHQWQHIRAHSVAIAAVKIALATVLVVVLVVNALFRGGLQGLLDLLSGMAK